MGSNPDRVNLGCVVRLSKLYLNQYYTKIYCVLPVFEQGCKFDEIVNPHPLCSPGIFVKYLSLSTLGGYVQTDYSVSCKF